MYIFANHFIFTIFRDCRKIIWVKRESGGFFPIGLVILCYFIFVAALYVALSGGWSTKNSHSLMTTVFALAG